MKLSFAVLSLAVLGASAAQTEKVLRGKHHHRVLEGDEEKKVLKEKEEKVLKEKVLKEKVMKKLDPKAREANLDLLNRMSQSTVTYAGVKGYACRSDADGFLGGPEDELADGTSNQYFDLVDPQDTLAACQELCTARADCVGIEYGHKNNRCELWKVETHMFKRNTFWGCYRKFQGAEDALCLASSEDLVSGSYLDETGDYVAEVADLNSIKDCTTRCANDPTCTGVGYDECADRCQIWTGDIGLMIPVKGQTCFTRFEPTPAVAEPALKGAAHDAAKVNSP